MGELEGTRDLDRSNMKPGFRSRIFFLFAIAILLAPGLTKAQDDTAPKMRLRGPRAVQGTVGGESHDSYVIRARRGQIMTVRISWRREGDNTAGISI